MSVYFPISKFIFLSNSCGRGDFEKLEGRGGAVFCIRQSALSRPEESLSPPLALHTQPAGAGSGHQSICLCQDVRLSGSLRVLYH